MKWSEGGFMDMMMLIRVVVKTRMFFLEQCLQDRNEHLGLAKCSRGCKNMFKYVSIMRWAEFTVSRVVPDLVNNERSLAEKR